LTNLKLPRRTFLHLAAGAAALPALSRIAGAQAYPTRPVRFIVPVAAGGSTDVAARAIGEYLSRTFGMQVYVENRAGAGGVIGIEAAARSAPDGYTILISTDRVASAPHVLKMTIDVIADLVPVVELSRQPVVLAVHSSLEINSLSGLIAYAKQQRKLSYATGGGIGTQQHFVAEWFAKIADIKVEHVPYRGGGQAINDLIAGHVKVGSLGSTPIIPHYKAGTLRVLAQSTEARSPSLPEVPTFQEAGMKGLVLDQWIGVFVPRRTPPSITSRLNTEINKALADATIRESLLQQAQEPVGGTIEQFTGLVRDDFEKYARLTNELNLKIE
jgi:tripartite-type tricarboxylate transporter receptor subunit TctC